MAHLWMGHTLFVYLMVKKKNMYKYFDKLIPESVCKNILNHASKSPIESIYKWGGRSNVGDDWLFQNKTFLQSLFLITQIASKSYGKLLFPELAEVTEWPLNTSQGLHIDSARTSTNYTSITYLNESYKGGQTYFESNNFLSKNKTGDTIMFNGVKHKHGVKTITQGTRYALAIWYSENINNFILNWENE